MDDTDADLRILFDDFDIVVAENSRQIVLGVENPNGMAGLPLEILPAYRAALDAAEMNVRLAIEAASGSSS